MDVLPIELVVFDFDVTLYNTSGSSAEQNPALWHSAKSLSGVGEPGWDTRWNLPVVVHARRASQSPWTRTVLLSARPRTSEMETALRTSLTGADLHFFRIILKPVTLAATTTAFKTMSVQRLLLETPSIERVSMFDDKEDQLQAVRLVVEAQGKKFFPILTVTTAMT